MVNHKEGSKVTGEAVCFKPFLVAWLRFCSKEKVFEVSLRRNIYPNSVMNFRTHFFKKVLFVVCILFSNVLAAQMSGVYSVPGSFASVAAAVSSINAVGVSGPVTVNIQAGITETVPLGGITLNPIAGGGATAAVVFQKSGIGSNPILVANTGTSTPSNNTQDCIWKIIGNDYITIDAIDLQDPNSSSPATMEYGYVFYRENNLNGCQHNIIKNCGVTLSTINVSSGGAKGIAFANCTYSTNLGNLTTGIIDGTNSYNAIYGNRISNVSYGIYVIGSNPFNNISLCDTYNNIGGNSAVTGNTVVNYGGGTFVGDVSGIYALFQSSLNVAYNTINNNTGSGTNPNGNLYGILSTHYQNANSRLMQNTISLQGSASTASVVGIQTGELAVANTNNSLTISGNQVLNCFNLNNPNGSVVGIRCAGYPYFCEISNNLVNGIAASNTVMAIAPSAPILLSVNANTLSSINFTNQGRGIALYNGSNNNTLTISNNLFENCTGTGTIYPIYSKSNSDQNLLMNNNILRNISLTGGSAHGIHLGITNGTWTANNNQIYNFSMTPTGSGVVDFIGIYSTVNLLSASGNSIHAFNTSASGVSAGVCYGIKTETISSCNLNANRIYDFTGGRSNAFLCGISAGNGGPNLLTNNLIGEFSNTLANSSNHSNGIMVVSGNQNKLYHNSVYLNSGSSSTLSGSSALYMLGGVLLEAINNIFVNTSTPTGTGLSTAFLNLGADLSSYSPSSNNNIFYAGLASSNRLIYKDLSNSIQSLSAYKQFAAPKDNFSATENPPFISTSGASANFLNLSNSIATHAESGGTPIVTVPTDVVNTLRSVSAPDIGAWEGNFINLDSIPPGIYSVGFTTSTTCNTSVRTLTVNLGDINGIASGSLAPRLYYKLNNNSFSTVAGVLSTGSATNGIWAFNMTFFANPLDVVSYFLVAQDQNTTSNLLAYPSVGFSGTDVNTFATAPNPLLSYTVNYTLAGSYTVGAGGTFTTLTDAATAYNNACLTGSVEFVLTNALYSASTAETFPIVFKLNPGASATNSLLVRPAAFTTPTIIASSTDFCIIKFLDSRYITFDGINATGNGLTFVENLGSSFSNSAVFWLANTTNTALCEHIGIKRCSMIGNSSNAVNFHYGVINSQNTSDPGGYGHSENVEVIGNNFRDFEVGVCVTGNGNSWIAKNWLIENNTFGDNAYYYGTNWQSGIQAWRTENLVVRGNNFIKLRNDNGSISVLHFYDSSTLTVVSQNTIQNILSNGGTAIGISVTNSSSGFTVTENIVKAVRATSSNNSGTAFGMQFTNISNTGLPCYIINNMISDIYAPLGGVGAHFSQAGNQNFWHNSVHLYGDHAGATYAIISAALRISYSQGGITINNNILRNSYRNTSATTGTTYAFYSDASSLSGLVMDNNAYSVGGPTSNTILAFHTTTLNSIAAIQSTLGGNVNSNTLQPTFVASDDLHIDMNALQNLSFDNLGQALGVTADIDLQSRSGSTPDIGADEFTITTCSTAISGSLLPISFSVCTGDPVVITATNAAQGVNALFNWKYSTTSGNNYSLAPSSSSTATYSNNTLNSGTYYFISENSCGSGTVTSNEATVTVVARPTATAVISSGVCTGGTVSFSATPNSLSGYLWLGPNSFTSAAQNGTLLGSVNSIGNYTLFTSNGFCNSLPVTASLNLVPRPATVYVSPSTTTICIGMSQTMTVSGGSIPKAFTYTNNGTGNTSISLPAPYSAYYGGQKMQILITASELLSNGNVAGPVYNIRFNALGFGSNWSNGFALQNFQVSIGSTSSPSLSGNFITGLTIVSPAQTFSPTLGYNTHYFSTPYMWDGISNLVVETVFSNNIASDINNAVFQNYGTMALPSTVIYVGNNQSFSAVNAASAGNVPMLTYRPNFILNASQAATYNWSPVNFLSAQVGSISVSTPTTSISYTVTAGTGACVNSTVVPLIVAQTPTLTFNPSTTSVCIGSSTTLSVTGASNYTWSTGAYTNTVAVSPTLSTVYSLTASSGPCPNVNGTVSVFVNALPQITLGVSSVTYCAGSTLSLTASGANNYLWFNNSTGSLTTYVVNTNTMVSVTGTNQLGCSSSTSITLTPAALPNILISPTTASVCPQQSLGLSASGANSYTWSGNPAGSSITVIPSSTTIYTVTGADAQICLKTQTVLVYVYQLPSVQISPNSTFVCLNNSVTLNASGANSYTWSNGSSSLSFSTIVTSNTVVTLSGLDNSNGCVKTVSANISVLALPVVSVAGPSAVCIGSTANYTAAGAFAYSWNNISGPSQNTLSVMNNTVLTLTGVNAQGCSSTITKSITGLALPVINVNPQSLSICADDTYSFTATGGQSYTWMPSNITGAVLSTANLSAGVYSVFGTGQNNCLNTASVNLNINNCTGITEAGISNSFVKIYPNPSSGRFNVGSDSDLEMQVRITNALGELISEMQFKYETTIDLSAYSNGLYFVSVHFEKNTEVFRVLLLK